VWATRPFPWHYYTISEWDDLHNRQTGPRDVLKATIKAAIQKLPDCADLLGGSEKGLRVLGNQNLVNIDDPQPKIGPSLPDYAVASATIRSDEMKGGTSAQTSVQNRTFTYVSSNFFSDSIARQAVLYFHELMHSAGANKEIDGDNMKSNHEEINKKCNFGAEL